MTAFQSPSFRPGGGHGTGGVRPEVGEVLAALAEQVRCYRALARLAERQHEHVLNDHTEGLLEVLREREVVLDRAAALERVVGPVKREWATVSVTMPAEQRRVMEGHLAEVRRLLAEITAGDERDALAMQQRKLRIGLELRSTSAATAVNRSYAASAYARQQAGQVDQRS